ncbi:hypothetical protein F5Y13DRAFT_117866 [Hypoxylon sp. FL1857]|nr:hypothetical protein F5Y13DRAFT_117866 [Hypoxylon sp. FL1857]
MSLVARLFQLRWSLRASYVPWLVYRGFTAVGGDSPQAKFHSLDIQRSGAWALATSLPNQVMLDSARR